MKEVLLSAIINSTALHRDLGILVSNDLTWNEHYSAIISKAYKSLYFIRRATSHTLNYLSTRAWLDPISYIVPSYGVRTKLKISERVQRRATEFILQDFQSDYKSRLTYLHFLLLSWLNTDIVSSLTVFKATQII